MKQRVIHEKGQVSADFQKESTLYGNSYYEKEDGRPLPFAKVSVQKIREMDTKRVDFQKVSVSAPIIQKCVHEVVKKSRLFPAFLCFKNRL
jgi:hypothetical protein